jgi:hypothetical protein
MESGITVDRICTSIAYESAIGANGIGDWIHHPFWFDIAYGIDRLSIDNAPFDRPDGWISLFQSLG